MVMCGNSMRALEALRRAGKLGPGYRDGGDEKTLTLV